LHIQTHFLGSLHETIVQLNGLAASSRDGIIAARGQAEILKLDVAAGFEMADMLATWYDLRRMDQHSLPECLLYEPGPILNC
jgi:hypothetical protein